MNVRDVVRWLQGKLGPINDLPSWLDELLSGFLVVGVAYGLLTLLGWLLSSVGAEVDLRAGTFPLALALSEGYEHYADPWGYNPQDVVERVRGVGLLLVVWLALR